MTPTPMLQEMFRARNIWARSLQNGNVSRAKHLRRVFASVLGQELRYAVISWSKHRECHG